MFRQLTQLQQRIAMGSLGSAIGLVAILFATVPPFKPIFTLFIASVIAIAMWELYQIYRAKGLEPAEKTGIALGAVYALSVAVGTLYPQAGMLPELVLLLSLLTFFFYYFSRGTSPLLNLSATVFGIIYLAVPLGCLIRIAYFFPADSSQDGRWWLLYLIAVTKMTDTGAFFVGRAFGREKLAPYISPKKTWEGALGGFAAAIATSLFVKFLTLLFAADSFGLTLWQSLWLGACIGVFAQCGDLSESLLKRDGGIKDSNHLPGLGGMLDIVDSLVFSAPLVYIFLKFHYSGGS